MRQVPDELPVGARCQPMASCGSATLTGVALRQLGRAGLALA
jgi:hypothetical protein